MPEVDIELYSGTHACADIDSTITDVTNARTGADDTSYQTLKARLDTENAEMKDIIIRVEAGTDVFQYGDIAWTDDKALKQSDEMYDAVFYHTSDYIEVYPDKTFSYDGLRSQSVYHPIVVFYDEDKEKVSAILGDGTSSQTGSVTVADGVKYVRVVTYKDTNVNKFNSVSVQYLRYVSIPEENANNISALYGLINIFAGKKAVFLGDSITEGMSPEYTPGHTAPAAMHNHGDKIYWEICGENLGLSSAIGYGVTGTTIKAGMGTSGEPFVDRYEDMDDDADFVCVFGGTNDFSMGSALGTIQDAPDKSASFYSALKYLIAGLKNKYPTARILFCTPLLRFVFGTADTVAALASASKYKYTKVTENGKWYYYDYSQSAWVEDTAYNTALSGGTATESTSDTYDFSYLIPVIKNSVGKTMHDYADAIKDVCNLYSIPVCDFMGACQIYPYTRSIRYNTIGDGTHPHSNQHIIMGRLLANFIRNNC